MMTIPESARALRRTRLPRPNDRLLLGSSGLKVSPLCLGLVPLPEIVTAAFDVGVNFFFVTADLHWPLYDGVRRGLEQLLARGRSIREEIVVGVVSYLDQPLFQHLQFNEVLESVRGLNHVDLVIAGAVPSPANFNSRFHPMDLARAVGRWGLRATGASFHDRQTALACINTNCIDVSYIRYNASHPGARHDLLPYLQDYRTSLIFNFTSMLGRVLPQQFALLGLDDRFWLPKAPDYYRFVLTSAGIDGLLCAPRSVTELHELCESLNQGPLTSEEEEYIIWLSTATNRKYF
jgi:hypothetical protein